MKRMLCLTVLVLLAAAPVLALDGYGCLKAIGTGADAVTVLYTGGTPYDIGYWHGSLLREQVQHNVTVGLAYARAEVGQAALLATWNTMAPFVPPEFHQELQGLADGSGVSLSDLHEYHAVPELSEYHCSAFNASGPATADGHMIQIRNLDWIMGMGIQDNPLVIVAEPAGGYKYANITFAGMIGCPAGINEKGIGVSEKGDSFDYAHETLAGIPMVFLLRDVLAHTASLAEANTMLQNAARTSSYWYLVGDADTPDARLYRTSPTIFDTWAPGQDPSGPSWALPNIVYHGMSEALFYSDLAANWGSITPEVAMDICRDIAMQSSLLEAVYDLTTREIWASYAEGLQPASGRDFVHLNTLEPPFVFQDDFESQSYTDSNWWQLIPKVSLQTQGGSQVLELVGGSGTECGVLAAGGRCFCVDGLTVGVDVRIPQGGMGGLGFGAEGAVQMPAGGANWFTYYLGLYPGSHSIELREDTAAGWPDPVLAEVVVPELIFDTWYRLELHSTLTNFEVWFAERGQPLVKVIDVAQDVLNPGIQSHHMGGVSLWAETRRRRMQFDNFRLEGVPAPIKQLACPGVRALREEACRVPVWLNDGEGVAGLQFDLYYDASLLTGLTGPQVEKGSLIAGDPDWTLAWNLVAPGHLKVLAYNTQSQPLPAGSHGEVMQAWLTVNPAAAPGSYTFLDLQGVVLSDRLGRALPSGGWDCVLYVARAAEWFEFAPITTPQAVESFFDIFLEARDEFGDPGTLYNGTANLTDLTGTISPASVAFTNGAGTAHVAIASAHAADTITATDSLDGAVHGTSNAFQVLAKGDVNGDGTVNVLDVVRTVAIALGTVTPSPGEFAAADANSDGVVNVLDVIIIQNLALGIHGMAPLGEARLGIAAKGTVAAPVMAAGAPPPAGAKRIAVPVVINSASGVAGFNFDLAYDSRVLTPVEVRAGTLLAGKADWVINANLARNPLRVLCYSRQSRALSGKGGTLVEVVFAQAGKVGKGALSLGGTAISDAAGKALSRTLSLGKAYTVK